MTVYKAKPYRAYYERTAEAAPTTPETYHHQFFTWATFGLAVALLWLIWTGGESWGG